MLDHIPRFDMKKPPMKQHLRPPYLLLCNHNAFMDIKVATKAVFPRRYCYPKDCDFSVTKIAFATEELYDHYWKGNGKNTTVKSEGTRTVRFGKVEI